MNPISLSFSFTNSTINTKLTHTLLSLSFLLFRSTHFLSLSLSLSLSLVLSENFPSDLIPSNKGKPIHQTLNLPRSPFSRVSLSFTTLCSLINSCFQIFCFVFFFFFTVFTLTYLILQKKKKKILSIWIGIFVFFFGWKENRWDFVVVVVAKWLPYIYIMSVVHVFFCFRSNFFFFFCFSFLYGVCLWLDISLALIWFDSVSFF